MRNRTLITITCISCTSVIPRRDEQDKSLTEYQSFLQSSLAMDRCQGGQPRDLSECMPEMDEVKQLTAALSFEHVSNGRGYGT